MKICDHEIVSKENMGRMKAAYAESIKGAVSDESFFGPIAEPFMKNIKVTVKKAKLV